jgi:hypothetical protein
LKQQIEVLEQDNRRHLEANDVLKRDVSAAVVEGGRNAEQDLTNLKRELAKLTIKLSQIKDAVERRVLQRRQAPLGQPETKDRTSWAEPHMAGLRTAIADGSAKGEEVQREAAGLIAQPWDGCPKVNQDLTNPEQELAKSKEGIRELLVYRKKGCRFTPVREKCNGAGICIEWPQPKQLHFALNEVPTFLTE